MERYKLHIELCRPFERTITLQKDSVGTVGFVFKENKITAIVKDSSAARNGVLTDHHLVEVDGQNVVGLKVRKYFCFKNKITLELLNLIVSVKLNLSHNIIIFILFNKLKKS